MFKKSFFAIATTALLLAGPAFAAPPQEQVDQMVRAQAAVSAKQAGIDEDSAFTYLKLGLAADAAEKAAKATGRTSDQVYASFLRQLAKVQVEGALIVAQGQTLMADLSTGIPGTVVPEPLAARAKAWAAMGFVFFKTNIELMEASEHYMEAVIKTDPECQLSGNKFAPKTCTDRLSKAAATMKIGFEGAERLSKSMEFMLVSVAGKLKY